MADLMRKYKVSFIKNVRAIDRVMAETIAADSFKSGNPDDVHVVLLEESLADREGTYRNELPRER